MDALNRSPVYPGAKIGILGGGQLGRMIALDARRMGYRSITLDPTPDSPCGQACDEQIVAAFTDVEAARTLAQSCDIVTYEFENVDADVAHVMEQFTRVPQGSQLLRTSQNRLREKKAVQSCGVQVAPFLPVGTQEALLHATAVLGFPCVLKTTEGGYDGQGQWLLRTAADAQEAWREWTNTARIVRSDRGVALTMDVEDEAGDSRYPLILEKFIQFELELSVVVARNEAGAIASFPVAENVHRNHILHLSIVPARVADDVQTRARALAERIAESLQVVGLLAVELFVTREGELYVNELAPRPHNSGHFTGDACITSQFEQHVRAICGLPLGDTKLLSPVVMVNILGAHVDAVRGQLSTLPATMKLHLYGKHEARATRKMGHINVLADTVEEALALIDTLSVWPRQA